MCSRFLHLLWFCAQFFGGISGRIISRSSASSTSAPGELRADIRSWAFWCFLARVVIGMVNAVGIPVMRYQPNQGYVSNHEVQTPPELAQRIVRLFVLVVECWSPAVVAGIFCAT